MIGIDDVCCVVHCSHNWGTENDPNFKYHSGNEPEHKGFGHICVFVDDLQKACARFTELGVPFKKRPEEGSMRHIGQCARVHPCCAHSFRGFHVHSSSVLSWLPGGFPSLSLTHSLSLSLPVVLTL
jgi:catechol 2,3-dioxygenase-like lactoylglutathione lyase family enzyme